MGARSQVVVRLAGDLRDRIRFKRAISGSSPCWECLGMEFGRSIVADFDTRCMLEYVVGMMVEYQGCGGKAYTTCSQGFTSRYVRTNFPLLIGDGICIS